MVKGGNTTDEAKTLEQKTDQARDEPNEMIHSNHDSERSNHTMKSQCDYLPVPLDVKGHNVVYFSNNFQKPPYRRQVAKNDTNLVAFRQVSIET
ncbi:hypothetical protein TNCV_2355691 [Trichonephila clavipes]|nr:hypothetical protein TNCV_2355691 [Trichonephila clavipes]